MSTNLRNVQFIDGGYCGQFGLLAGAKSWSWTRFHAVFVYFEHPQHGPSLIDTGYSQYFFEATRRFPHRFHRWMTPTKLVEPTDPAEKLKQRGLDPLALQRLFISHFHADHIGGLRCFADLDIVCRMESLSDLQQLPARKQVEQGFLSKLLPDDLVSRTQEISTSDFLPNTGDLSEFSTCDFWGDGSLLLIDLPGHANGHYGFFMRTESEDILYCVDACWQVDAMLEQRKLPSISRNFQYDWPAYVKTQEKLRHLSQQSKMTLLACHCPHTMKRVSCDHD